ncbi:lipase family protein [Rhodococcus sp. AG1013]|uniref:lipase family protein n=1 Tax=unclassified Rhodococcus (in: high G+C Gram-positive bacteria) TaxID=192944 RepID=UPI000E0B9E9E|nr:lipase family protein [Rhodococcus sp. AG1013]RDI33758.1 secretory lipase [Rhodococcus sp. AG1013]
MKKLRTSLLATAVAAAALLAGAPAVAAAPNPVGLDEVFSPFVVSTFTDGRIAPFEKWQARHPVSDPWYQAPPVGDAPAGTLLKARPATVQVYGVQPGHVRGYQLMYVTTDFDGSAAVSTGMLMIPEDGTAPQDRKLIGYSEANDSLGPGCMPSTQWTGGDQDDPSLFSALGPVAQMFGNGWAVMMSDTANDGDPTPNGFSIGQFSGAATLDGLRAALALPAAGFSPDTPVGIYGIAGGGVAAGFAAEKQATYAPELNVVGTVLQAMVVDSATFERKADGGIGAGFVFANSLGYAARYPEIDLDQELTPLGRQIADVFNRTCQQTYLLMPFVPLSALYTHGRPADNPVFARAYAENRLGLQAPKAPVLMTSCRDDFLVPYSDVEQLVAAYRAGGTEVTVDPSVCGMSDVLTDPWRVGTELLGMQNVDWFVGRFEEARR